MIFFSREQFKIVIAFKTHSGGEIEIPGQTVARFGSIGSGNQYPNQNNVESRESTSKRGMDI